MSVAVRRLALVAANRHIARRSALEAQMHSGVPHNRVDPAPDPSDSVLTRPRPEAVGRERQLSALWLRPPAERITNPFS